MTFFVVLIVLGFVDLLFAAAASRRTLDAREPRRAMARLNLEARRKAAYRVRTLGLVFLSVGSVGAGIVAIAKF